MGRGRELFGKERGAEKVVSGLRPPFEESQSCPIKRIMGHLGLFGTSHVLKLPHEAWSKLLTRGLYPDYMSYGLCSGFVSVVAFSWQNGMSVDMAVVTKYTTWPLIRRCECFCRRVGPGALGGLN